MKAHLEGLQAAFLVAEEEVAKARASAAAAQVRAGGEFSTMANSCFQVFVLESLWEFLVIVLEGQLAASHREVEKARL